MIAGRGNRAEDIRMNEKLNYELIASDLDGTLLKDDKTVDRETRDAIHRYIAAGGKFCICTGRMLPSVEKIAADLGVGGIATSYAGALVSNLDTGEILYENSLSAADAAEIADFVERDRVHLQFYTGRKYYVNCDNEMLAHYETSCRVKAERVLNRSMASLIREKNERVNKLLIVVEDSERHGQLLEKYLAKFGERFWVTRSTPRYIEILSKTCNKGTALKFMAEYYHIPIEKTIAAGDQLNDEEMLNAAGIGFCMENGNEEMKARVRVFPAGNNDNAVGKIIEEYGFSRR